MPFPFELGRKPPRATYGSLRRSLIVAKNLEALGTPPASSDNYVYDVDAATGGDWGMAGNDNAGDCTCADSAHTLMLRTANASSIVIPTTEQTLAMYTAITGYDPAQTDAQGNNPTDQGADELTVIQYLTTHGLLGHKIDASANIDPTNLDHLKWTVQIYGYSRLGVLCTDSMMDQFQNGEPWYPVTGAHIEGGHDVPLVRYIRDGLTTMYFVVTWGRLQPVTEQWLTWQLEREPVVEEAHAEASLDFIRATGASPAGLDNEQQIAELQSVQV